MACLRSVAMVPHAAAPAADPVRRVVAGPVNRDREVSVQNLPVVEQPAALQVGMDPPEAAAQVAGVDLVEPFAHPGVRGRRLDAEQCAGVPRPDRILPPPQLRVEPRQGRHPGGNTARPDIRRSDRLRVRGLSGSGMRSRHSRIVRSIPGIDGRLRKEGPDMVLPGLCLYCRQDGRIGAKGPRNKIFRYSATD